MIKMSLDNILASIPDLSEDASEKNVSLEEVFGMYPCMERDSPLPYVIYRGLNIGKLTAEEDEKLTQIIERLKRNEDYINQKNLKKMLEPN